MKYTHLLILIIILNVYTAAGKRRHHNKKGIEDETLPERGNCRLEVFCEGDNSGPYRVPIKGPRGPPGVPGPRGERGPQGAPGVPGKSTGELLSSVDKTGGLAFFVGLQENINSIKTNEDLIFDKVITNIGESYDPETGRFTAPCNGTYKFTVVVAAQGKHKAAVTMMKTKSTTTKNGEMVFRVWAESIPFWSTASNTAVLRLFQGQEIWLQVLQGASHLHGYMYTTWSGHMLFTDNNDICDV